MAKEKKQYICKKCGSKFLTWYGQCPNCGEWNSLQQIFFSKKHSSIQSNRLNDLKISTPICSLDKNLPQEEVYFSTKIKEIDTFLGKGLVRGGVYLLGGEPGIGKSTWLLQLAGFLARKGLKTIYISGEESLAQVKSRANRLGIESENLYFFYSLSLEEIMSILKQGYDFAVVDSVQTITSSNLESVAGSPSQVREVTLELISLAKSSALCLFLVGHVTKDGTIAGPKLLEHMVDCVLYLEGDREHLFRILRVVKNRYGPADEVLILEMKTNGLEVVKDPATFFLQDGEKSFSGQALTLTLEGQKVLAVEVQALVNNSFLAMPRRVSQGIDQNRLNLLLAVIEKKIRINLKDKDVYVKIGGGLQIKEPGLDLALCAAVLSSFYDTSLPKGSVFWGEIDLNGQIRNVLGHDLRMRQAKRLGYAPIFAPSKALKSLEDMHKILFA
ncbi:DNA repair protein RadA/Sms [Desulfonauticus submarinus]|uniref:DNA repair protein RadA n=1 Tax=Desulfonauticus submarinus TaxID=206665 RepID=A0A1H0CGY9_9BACT|nr:DNA repair protein RadA [Desulfonauticus submarinus]SDN57137.1 DNA repair protein RadA/Sms [Desulfonauticus submarinus]